MNEASDILEFLYITKKCSLKLLADYHTCNCLCEDIVAPFYDTLSHLEYYLQRAINCPQIYGTAEEEIERISQELHTHLSLAKTGHLWEFLFLRLEPMLRSFQIEAYVSDVVKQWI